jgi:hypothetical protein
MTHGNKGYLVRVRTLSVNARSAVRASESGMSTSASRASWAWCAARSRVRWVP